MSNSSKSVNESNDEVYQRTNLVVATAIVATTFLFILPLTLGVFFLETIFRGDHFDRSFERWPVSSFDGSEKSSDATTSTAIDSDAVDRACDLLVSFARSAFDDNEDNDGGGGGGGTGKSFADVPARAIASILRRELRVIYNV